MQIFSRVNSFFLLAFSYILPYRCFSCSELINEDNALCSSCFQKLNFIVDPYCKTCSKPFDFKITGQFECGQCIASSPKYDIGRSLMKFDLRSKEMIHAFKYNDKTKYAKFFAKLLVARYKKDFEDADFIAPVPMHRLKRVFRGYNPSQILAHAISKYLNVQLIPDLLVKNKWTKTQTSLSKSQRQKNLAGSIDFNKKYCIKGKNILLVDDVKTTGSTSNNCSAILKKFGAKSVKLATIALT